MFQSVTSVTIVLVILTASTLCSAQPPNSLRDAWRRSGDFVTLKRGIDKMNAMIESDRRPGNLLIRGYFFLDAEDYTAAKSDFNEVLQKSPLKVSALLGRALAHQGLREYQAANDDFALAQEWADQGYTNDEIHTGAHVFAAYSLFLAECPDMTFRDASRALNLGLAGIDSCREWGELPECTAGVAASYKEFGNILKAVEWQRRAVCLAEDPTIAEAEWTVKMYSITLCYNLSLRHTISPLPLCIQKKPRVELFRRPQVVAEMRRRLEQYQAMQ